jgi:mannose-1-phosphate guanylyltransferase/mannose-1-phosphate guanylyltransferase/mannose-6-phosphate isomerase
MPNSNDSQPKITPVILSGGAGTRLWPLSRESYPKQLLALTSDLSLLQGTARRVSDRNLFEAPLLVSNADHRFIVAEQLRHLDIAPRAIVLEPVGRNTAPAAAAAAIMLAETDPNALMLVLPSDHAIEKTDEFISVVRTAAAAAGGGALVTFGITPTHPETGYGYIQRGERLDGRAGCYVVDAFAEKPDAETAAGYLADGGYDWNSGMFLFSARSFLDELERREPAMVSGCRKAVAGAERDLDFLRLADAPFRAVPARSIDYAVMEHTDRAAVVPADIGWSDVGSWSSLWDVSEKDAAGNALTGDVMTFDVKNSYIRSEGRLVTALGVSDMIVVATDDSVLVMPKDRAQDVKTIVDALKLAKRDEATQHPRVYRPWGYYQTVHDGDRFQVKRITVSVGASLSKQMHHHRAEHWIVVNGTAEVTRGEETFLLHENESVYIPPATIHRLANPGKVPINLIEVQSGAYLGEDDIVRYEDDYGRD